LFNVVRKPVAQIPTWQGVSVAGGRKSREGRMTLTGIQALGFVVFGVEK
jgi:hypothetical protein